MFTEFHYNVELVKNLSRETLDILYYMLDKSSYKCKSNLKNIPSHPLFTVSERWEWMLYTDSCFFSADTISTLRYDDIAKVRYLCIRCNLKNYNNEIENFIDWIDPYVYGFTGDFLGFYRYEESEDPVIVRKK